LSGVIAELVKVSVRNGNKGRPSRDVYTHLAQMMQWTAKEIERVAASAPGARSR